MLIVFVLVVMMTMCLASSLGVAVYQRKIQGLGMKENSLRSPRQGVNTLSDDKDDGKIGSSAPSSDEDEGDGKVGSSPPSDEDASQQPGTSTDDQLISAGINAAALAGSMAGGSALNELIDRVTYDLGNVYQKFDNQIKDLVRELEKVDPNAARTLRENGYDNVLGILESDIGEAGTARGAQSYGKVNDILDNIDKTANNQGKRVITKLKRAMHDLVYKESLLTKVTAARRILDEADLAGKPVDDVDRKALANFIEDRASIYPTDRTRQKANLEASGQTDSVEYRALAKTDEIASSAPVKKAGARMMKRIMKVMVADFLVMDMAFSFGLELIMVWIMQGKPSKAQVKQAAVNAVVGFVFGTAAAAAVGAAIGGATGAGVAAGAIAGATGGAAGAASVAGPAAAVIIAVAITGMVLDIFDVGGFNQVKYNKDLKAEKKLIDDVHMGWLPLHAKLYNWAIGSAKFSSGELVPHDSMDFVSQDVSDKGGQDVVAEGNYLNIQDGKMSDTDSLTFWGHVATYMDENNLTIGPDIADILNQVYESQMSKIYKNPKYRQIKLAERDTALANVKKEAAKLKAIEAKTAAIKAGFYDLNMKLALTVALKKSGATPRDIKKVLG